MKLKTALSTILTFSLVIMLSNIALASWEGARVINEFDTVGDNVTSVAFNCLDENCSQVDQFSGSYPYGDLKDPKGELTKNPGTGNITIDYPADLQDHGYAVYFFSPGYIPKAYHDDFYCTEGSKCGPVEQTVDFNKHDKCTAEVDSFTVTNDIYENEPVVVDVDASVGGDIQSAFEENDNGVEHIPDDYKDPYYEAKTRITMRVYDENGTLRNDFTESTIENIFMNSSVEVQFQWTPDKEGNHTVEIATTVPDSMCQSTEELSSSKDIYVQEERPQEEYYTLVDNLSVDNSYQEVNEQQTLSFKKISNFADENYTKTPVETKTKYVITDEDGNTVLNDSETLPANSNTEDWEEYSFTWTPSEEGIYTVRVRGESVKSEGDYPTSPENISMDIDVDPEPVWNVEFQVNDETGQEVEGATVDMGNKTETTDTNGQAVIRNLTEGEYTYEVSADFYNSSSGEMSITRDSPNPIEKSVTISSTNTPPEVSDIPNVTMVEGGSVREINLNEYVQDDQTTDSDINWSADGNENISVQITNVNYAELDPGSGWEGSEEINFTAKDEAGATDSDTMIAEVQPNTPPSVSDIPDAELEQGEEEWQYVNLKDYVKDEETDFSDINITISDNECGVVRDGDFLNILPDSDFYGSCDVLTTAEDKQGETDSNTFNVQVNRNETPPQISTSPPKEVDAYSEYRYEMSVDSGYSMANLTFTVQEGPQGIVVNKTSNRGVFTWNYPEADDVGNHTVRLGVEDPENQTDTQEYTLEVKEAEENEPPVPIINASPESGEAPLTVEFNGSESYDPYNETEIVSYEWDFGDGARDSGEQVSYTYEKEGSYTASLTVEDEFGSSATSSVEIEVLESSGDDDDGGDSGGSSGGSSGSTSTSGGISTFSSVEENLTVDAGSDLQGSVGEELTFDGDASADNGEIVSYRWDFHGDGNWDYESSEDGNTVYAYEETGTYEAVFEAETEEGTVENDTIEVTIEESRETITEEITIDGSTFIYTYNATEDRTTIELTVENNDTVTSLASVNMTFLGELSEEVDSLEFEPPANETIDNSMIWELELEPGESKTITVGSSGYISSETFEENIEVSEEMESTETPVGFFMRNITNPWVAALIIGLFILVLVLRKEERRDKVKESLRSFKETFKEKSYSLKEGLFGTGRIRGKDVPEHVENWANEKLEEGYSKEQLGSILEERGYNYR